jgi:replicative superfamily II helicase
MVDFKKLREGKGKPRPIIPRDIFNALPKPPGINDLYASQAEVLDIWFGRRSDRDVVIKLHTGGGKTLVALLMAQSVMNEHVEPVLYLAPTNQLVGQVLAMSRDYGIPALPYAKGQPLPGEFYDGKSVLVGAYETLFNGRSRFGVRGSGQPSVNVGAIILELSASAARIAHQMEDEDRGQKFQTSAFSVNNNHTPPKVRPAYTPRPMPGRQSAAIVARLLEYDRRGAMIADFDDAVAELVPEASAGRYEEALENLGAYLGFEAERPEKVYGIGPDVLWRTDAPFDFVIEAKSEKDDNNPLYKKDHAQLLEAEHWFKSTYPERESGVSALPEAVADEKVTPMGSYALPLAEISKIVGALRAVLRELIACPGGADALRERCEVALQKANLKPGAIRQTFMKPFDKAAAVVCP